LIDAMPLESQTRSLPVRCPAAARSLIAAATMGLTLVAGVGRATEFSAAELAFFETDVRPLLAEHCYECHSAESDGLRAGLRVDTRDGLLAGGDSGSALEPGDADASLLMQAVRYESFEMPPAGKLPDEEIAILVRWIEMGAPWPDEPSPDAAAPAGDEFDLQQRRETHWAWQPIDDPVPPEVGDPRWPASNIDRFVLARLDQAGLRPAPEADRRALVRRLYFDLIGLPPTPEEVARVVHSNAPDPIAALVDRLLDSPHFGERWGRHWLDLVRYAESRGHEFDEDAANAYQYRDYVIRAFNADVAYDQFIREHIAGDLLAEPRRHPVGGWNESLLGTGFWFLGEWVHSPVDIRKDEADRFDNMIDVMSKTFLGVTVACARCHDHKFDAISTADYYALSGFLQSSEYRLTRFESEEHNRRIASRLAELNAEMQDRLRPVIAESLVNSLEDLADTGRMPADKPPWTVPRGAGPPNGGRVVVDYASIPDRDYRQNGVIYGPAPRSVGSLSLEAPRPGSAGDGSPSDRGPTVTVAAYTAAANDPFWNGLVNLRGPVTNRRSKLKTLPRPGRTLRSPAFELTGETVHCQVHGSGHIVACVDSHRLVAGPLHGETVVRVKPGESDDVRWVTLRLGRYSGHRLHLEFTPDPGETLEVLRVAEGPRPDVEMPGGDGKSGSPRATLRAALHAWRDGELSTHPRAVEFAAAIRWALAQCNDWQDTLVGGQHPVRRWLRRWDEQRRELKQQRQVESRLAMAMMDGSPENDHLLIRGNSSNPGREVPRRFLAAIDGEAALAGSAASGRLELADRIADPANPLTSRVIVNRIWHHLLGRGIVPTTDDFGVLGERPTHPKLLDHLASWFDRNGRSIKKTIRYVVLSSTYRMSTRVSPQAAERDPKNLLWHHVPPKRLQGEAIRDALLAISGELDRDLYGEPVPVHLTDFMDGRGRPGHSGPLDGDARRSIYTAVRRNFLSPFMLAFDTPVPFSTMGCRNVSNVPAQALILMNDPFVIGRTQQWARRAIREVEAGVDERIRWMYRTAVAREPTANELAIARHYVVGESRVRGSHIDDPEIWADLAHAMVNTKEFIFLR
jgi:hypothetical protein